MSQTLLCEAIRSRTVVQFHYSAEKSPGIRVVEPHMIAYNRRGNLILSGWYLRGASESATGEGWREYLLEGMTSVTVLSARFFGPRPGYKPDGGKMFQNVQCAL